MKCKLCGKKGVQLAHWRREHGDLMARRSKNAPRCGCGKRKGHRGDHKKGSKLAGGSESSKTRTETHQVRRSRGKTYSSTPPSERECPPGFIVESITYRRA